MRWLREGLLSHDVVEVVSGDLLIAVGISAFDHLLEFLFRDVFPKLFGHSSQVLDADESRVLLVEESEDLGSSSTRLLALFMSSRVSLSLMRAVIMFRNSLIRYLPAYSKSIEPLLFLSRSEIIWKIVWFLASNPRLCMAAFNSLGSIVPLPSVSKRSKASLISSISSSVSPGRSYLSPHSFQVLLK